MEQELCICIACLSPLNPNDCLLAFCVFLLEKKYSYNFGSSSAGISGEEKRRELETQSKPDLVFLIFIMGDAL